MLLVRRVLSSSMEGELTIRRMSAFRTVRATRVAMEQMIMAVMVSHALWRCWCVRRRATSMVRASAAQIQLARKASFCDMT